MPGVRWGTLSPPPINAAADTAHGLPWFDLDDEEMPDLPASPTLVSVMAIPERKVEPG